MLGQPPNVLKKFSFHKSLSGIMLFMLLLLDVIFLLPLVYVISFVDCIFVFPFCTCAVSVTGHVTVVPALKKQSTELLFLLLLITFIQVFTTIYLKQNHVSGVYRVFHDLWTLLQEVIS